MTDNDCTYVHGFTGCLQVFIAALLQYLFVSAFHWMFCEGVLFYIHDAGHSVWK